MKSVIFYCGDGNSLVNFRLELIKLFIRNRFKVYAFGPYIKNHNLAKLSKLGVVYESTSMERKNVNPFSFVNNILSLRKKIRKIKPDFIFSYTHKPVVVGAFAAAFIKRTKIISLITGTGHLFDDYNFKVKFRKFFGLLVFKVALFFSYKVIFQNPDNKKLFSSLGLVNKQKSYLVNGSGVDLDLFSFSNIPEGEFIFLCLARLIKSKGLIEFAKIAKLIKQDFPNVRFLIGGDEDFHEDAISLNEIRSQWPSKYGIEFIGYVDDPLTAMKKCSVYVLLSYNEGTPRSVLEAMSVGRPIITTDVSGCKETVIHKKNGYLVPVKNIDKAAEYFRKIIHDDIETMGRESRRFCKSKYDVHNVNREIFNILGINAR